MSKGRHIRRVKQRPTCSACGGPLRQRQGAMVCDRCNGGGVRT